jgi:Histone methylation protein DOT1
MDHDMSEHIQDTLSAIEQHQRLADLTRFSERVDALETIEFQILDRIENLMYVHGHQADLALLYRRAAQLWQFLTNINDQLFQRLRDELASSTAPAATLRQQLRTYVTQSTVRDPVGYDDLDMFINGLFGIDTEPQETRPLKAGMIGYQATPARFILDLIERIPLGPDDVFFDLGSGLGRVALLVGLLTPARVRGIEYDPGHCAYARHCARLVPAPRVRFINVDAREADVADGTVFFMYTPFRGALLQEVLDRLKDKAHRRPMTLVTYGPCTAEVAELDWLALSGSEEPDDRSLAIFTRL